MDTTAHRALALDAARQGIVLALNRNATLPLRVLVGDDGHDAGAETTQLLLQRQHGVFDGAEEGAGNKAKNVVVAVVGPNAAATSALLSNYHGAPPFTPVSVVQGLTDIAAAKRNGSFVVTHAEVSHSGRQAGRA